MAGKKKEDKKEKKVSENTVSGGRELPKPTFPQIVDTFFIQTMISIGKQMNPMNQKYERDLPIARYQIGILELLEEKTKGNLSEEEETHLTNALHTLRMAYLDESGREPNE